MSALINPNPIVIAPVVAKEFPHLWIYNINIHAPSTSSGRIIIETLPYNYDTKEIGNGSGMVAISTDDLWTAVGEVPQVAQAMGAIFAAIGPLRDWVAAKEAAKLAAQEAANNVVVPEEEIEEEEVSDEEDEIS